MFFTQLKREKNKLKHKKLEKHKKIMLKEFFYFLNHHLILFSNLQSLLYYSQIYDYYIIGT